MTENKYLGDISAMESDNEFVRVAQTLDDKDETFKANQLNFAAQ